MSLFAPTNLSPNNVGVNAATPITFTWEYNGTNPQTNYQVEIYELDNTLAYDSTKITSGDSQHVLSSTLLSNGEFYKWRVTVWDATGSVVSGWVVIKTNSTPTVTLTSLPDPFEYQNYTFTATYNQAEGIILKSYRFILYDNNDQIVFDTDEIYSTTISYEITGLSNFSDYSIECVVTSQNDMTATTGLVEFYTEYEIPDSTPDLVITSLDDEGAIRADWANVVQILGVVTGDYSFVKEFLESYTSQEDFELGEVSENVEITVTGEIQFTYDEKILSDYYGRTLEAMY